MRSSESRVPSVGTSAANEWPAPTQRTGPPPPLRSAATAASSAGSAKVRGRQRWMPDQFSQLRAEAAEVAVAAAAMPRTGSKPAARAAAPDLRNSLRRVLIGLPEQ